jgi:hypothetical protein
MCERFLAAQPFSTDPKGGRIMKVKTNVKAGDGNDPPIVINGG